MCFHQDTGRETDGEHKTGSIFANAASVLSMAAEEISLDDHLEKELANEVELWRMETTTTTMHASDAYRTVFAPLDKLERNTIESNSPFSTPGGRLDSIEDIDDMAEYSECPSRSNEASAARRKLASGSAGSGMREGTGLSTESSGQRQTTGSSPNEHSREETNTTWREVTSQQEVGSSLATFASGSSTAVETVAGEPTTEPMVRDRVISLGARPSPSPSGTSTGITGPTIAASHGSLPSRLPKDDLREASNQTLSDAAPVERTADGETRYCPREASVPTVSDAAVGEAADEAPGRTQAALAMHGDNSSFSTSEDSFPGFIEDALEKEMGEEVFEGSPGYVHGAWATLPNDCYYRDHEGRVQKSAGGQNPIQVRGPGEALEAITSLEGVRADRDAF
jgi:hypothetical protein